MRLLRWLFSRQPDYVTMNADRRYRFALITQDERANPWS